MVDHTKLSPLGLQAWRESHPNQLIELGFEMRDHYERILAKVEIRRSLQQVACIKYFFSFSSASCLKGPLFLVTVGIFGTPNGFPHAKCWAGLVQHQTGGLFEPGDLRLFGGFLAGGEHPRNGATHRERSLCVVPFFGNSGFENSFSLFFIPFCWVWFWHRWLIDLKIHGPYLINVIKGGERLVITFSQLHFSGDFGWFSIASARLR